MRLGTQAQEAAKRGDGVNDMAANLFDDETFDGSDLLAMRVVNSGALDVIALDQRVAWSRGRICLCHSSFPPVFSQFFRFNRRPPANRAKAMLTSTIRLALETIARHQTGAKLAKTRSDRGCGLIRSMGSLRMN